MHATLTLNFEGRTEAALDLYRAALGAEITFLMRMRDCPDRSLIRPGNEDQIFHATFLIGQTQIMASDVGGDRLRGGATFAGFALAIQADSAEQAERMFAALRAGGTVLIPLAAAAFTGMYGIVKDAFGVVWKITLK